MEFNTLSTLEQKEIIEVLEQLGFNEKDREIYFVLLKSGPSTISPVARATGYPVTTVQSVLSRLDKKGVLEVTTKKTRHVYKASDPSIIKKNLERKIQDVGNIIPLLKKISQEERGKAKVKVYYNDRMSDIFHEAINCKNKLVYEIVSAHDFQLILGEKFHFTKRRLEKDIYLKSLRVEEHEIKKYNKTIHKNELREAKFLPREMTFRASMMLWDNTVAFFSSKGEGLAWTVESITITEMMKQMFEMMWEVSRRMETLPEDKN